MRVHWEFRHFVVLKGFSGSFAYINDPAHGRPLDSCGLYDDHNSHSSTVRDHRSCDEPVFIDRLLTGENMELIKPYMTLPTCLAALEIITLLIQQVYSLKIRGDQ